ncbi:MAG: hypothetical protein Q9208_003838 [Pyrenodesmia sp. 3 TL-2023]
MAQLGGLYEVRDPTRNDEDEEAEVGPEDITSEDRGELDPTLTSGDENEDADTEEMRAATDAAFVGFGATDVEMPDALDADTPQFGMQEPGDEDSQHQSLINWL